MIKTDDAHTPEEWRKWADSVLSHAELVADGLYEKLPDGDDDASDALSSIMQLMLKMKETIYTLAPVKEEPPYQSTGEYLYAQDIIVHRYTGAVQQDGEIFGHVDITQSDSAMWVAAVALLGLE